MKPRASRHTCTKCGIEKPDGFFALRPATGKPYSWCRLCKQKWDREAQAEIRARKREEAEQTRLDSNIGLLKAETKVENQRGPGQ